MILNSDINDNLQEFFYRMDEIGVAVSSISVPYKIISSQNSTWPNITYLISSGFEINLSNIHQLIDEINTKKYPKLLIVSEEMINEELTGLLKENYFFPVTLWTNMFLPNIISNAENTSLTSVTVKEIKPSSTDEIIDWCKIVSESLFQKKELDPAIFSIGIKENLFKLLIAYYEDKPAATSLLFTGKMAGIYMFATSPLYRRKGLGKQMMTFTQEVALRYGYKSLLLQSTKEGIEFYKNIGFKPLDKLYLFYYIK